MGAEDVIGNDSHSTPNGGARPRRAGRASGRVRSAGRVDGSWAVFRTTGPHPQALQETWAATATEWFPSNRWRLRPGPEIVAVLEHADDFSTATCELWLPVEPT